MCFSLRLACASLAFLYCPPLWYVSMWHASGPSRRSEHPCVCLCAGSLINNQNAIEGSINIIVYRGFLNIMFGLKKHYFQLKKLLPRALYPIEEKWRLFKLSCRGEMKTFKLSCVFVIMFGFIVIRDWLRNYHYGKRSLVWTFFFSLFKSKNLHNSQGTGPEVITLTHIYLNDILFLPLFPKPPPGVSAGSILRFT